MSSRNVLIFPRKFADGRIIGVDPKGEPVSIDIQIPDTIRQRHRHNPKAVIPDYATIARGNPKRAGCVAGEGNSFHNRTGGVLLLQDAVLEGQYGDTKHFTGSWASILAHNRSEPNPLLGVGYVETLPMISHDRKEDMASALNVRRQISNLYSKLSQSILNKDGTQELQIRNQISHLTKKLDDLARFFYATTLVKCSESKDLAISKKSNLRDYLVHVFESNTKQGALGGALIRTVGADGTIVEPHCVQNRIRYNPYSSTSNLNDNPSAPYGSETTLPVDEVDRMLNSPQMRGLVGLNWSKYKLIVTPMMTLTYAYKAAQEHNQDRKRKQIHDLYTDQNDGSYKAYSVAVKYIPGSSNPEDATLKAGATYNLSPALGNPMLLDNTYRVGYEFSRTTPAAARNAFQHLAHGRQYTIQTPDGNVGIATAKLGADKKIRLYINNKAIPDVDVIAEAPKAFSPSMDR